MRVSGVARQVLARQAVIPSPTSVNLCDRNKRVACNGDGKERKNEKLRKVSLVGLS